MQSQVNYERVSTESLAKASERLFSPDMPVILAFNIVCMLCMLYYVMYVMNCSS